ncbi:MAG: hypothetical protein QXL18_03835 [Candidatus Woesearchaeota archaeon]
MNKNSKTKNMELKNIKAKEYIQDNKKSLSVIINMFVLIFLLVLFSDIAYSQEILTENSNTYISNITILLNSTYLNLKNTTTYNYSENDTNYTIIDNIENVVDYYCELNGLQQKIIFSNTLNASELIVLNITLFNGSITDGIYALLLNCTYNIAEHHNLINITYNILNQTTTEQNFTVNLTKNILTNKTIIVDTLKPVINYDLNNLTINISVTDLSNTSCRLYYNITESSVAPQQLFYNETILFNKNLQYLLDFNNKTNLTLNQSLNQTSGIYSINILITCFDELQNLEKINFTISYIVNNTLLPEPFLNISINKQNIPLGEIAYITINALNSSNVSITICPIAQGWVECYMTPIFINETYPKIQIMPYSNKTGNYIIEAYMHHGNISIYKNLTFSIVNNINAVINYKKTAAVNEIITFNVTSTGGIGNHNYLWLMHDGQKFYGPAAYKNFTSPGRFTEKLFINDSQGNTYNTSVDVDIKQKYQLIVIVNDEKGIRVKDALVEAGSFNATTNSAGEARFLLMESKYDVYVSKEGYGAVVEDINLDSNLTVNINISVEDYLAPNVILLTDDKSVFSDIVKLKFKAEDITKLRCELYIAGYNESWFRLEDYGDNLLNNTEYTFELNSLKPGKYKWKIDCIDEKGNKGESSEYYFTIEDKSISLSLEQNDRQNSDINKALDRMNSYAGPAATIIESLGIKKSLKELLEKSNNLERDLHNVDYRRDLDEKGKQELRDKLVNDITVLRNSIPEDIKVTGSKTFIKYVKEQQLKDLLKEYVQLKSMNVNLNSFLESTKRAQNKIIVSTNVITATLFYPDGNSRDITLIKKDISLSNPSYEGDLKSTTASIVEIIPKNVAADVNLLNILNKEYTVLKKDPILEFLPSTRSIIYYINDTLDIEIVEETDTVLIDKNIKVVSTTGFSIVNVESIKNMDIKIVLIILIFVLIVIYVFTSFEVFPKIFSRILWFNYKKKISYIRVLVNDSLDYLAANDYDNAALVYREIRLAYESSPESVKNEVYQECYDLCNSLDSYYFNELNEEFERYINLGLKEKAFSLYQKMEKVYDKMDEKIKKDYRTILDNAYKKLGA